MISELADLDEMVEPPLPKRLVPRGWKRGGRPCSPRTAALRLEAVRLHQQGLTKVAIGKQLGYSETYIRKLLRDAGF